MWARVVEVMLGCWLAASPWIFRHPADATMLWASDWIAATAVIAFALLSFWRPLQYLHLLTGAAALVMFGLGWMQDRPTPPGWQNEMFVALLLLMTCLVPNYASRPPRAWREYYKQQGIEMRGQEFSG
jgi:hypothetical protein